MEIPVSASLVNNLFKVKLEEIDEGGYGRFTNLI